MSETHPTPEDHAPGREEIIAILRERFTPYPGFKHAFPRDCEVAADAILGLILAHSKAILDMIARSEGELVAGQQRMESVNKTAFYDLCPWGE